MASYSVLGVHDGHCASACLLQDGVLTHAVQEERFVNRKNYPGMPVNAINWIFEDIGEMHVDCVALATKFIHEPGWYLAQGHYERSRSRNQLMNRFTWPIKRRISPYFRHRLDERKTWLRRIVGDVPISVVEHHLAHAAAAYYGSHYDSYEPVTILTADGSGDGLSATVSTITDKGILRLDEFNSTRSESIGNIYSLTTHYLGFTPWEHEYKLMGMAPYSVPKKEILDGLNSIVRVENGRFVSTISTAFAYDFLRRIYYRQRFDWICASLQKWFEDLMTRWVGQLFDVYKFPRKLACAGGDYMNVKANMEISRMPGVDDIFVFPSAGDESTSIGAAMEVYADWCLEHGMNPKKEIRPIGSLYLGPPSTTSGPEGMLDKSKFECVEWDSKNIPKIIAELVEEGEIVARCSGNLEFGARALGNRSILADGSNDDVKLPLNAAIKQRDFWMPFAPSILHKARKELVDNPKDIRAPYMIMAFPSTTMGRVELKAAMHPYDFTLRPQIVEKEWNPDYWQILEEFRRRTGNGGLLNTSFNLHGYPIVFDLPMAIWTLENSGLKYLVVENWMIEKKA